MPAPPPPPPGAPPPLAPPPPVNIAPVKNVDRGALLSSIRQGTKLKKTVTNDRSAPVIGKVTSSTSNSSSSVSNSSSNVSSSTPNGIALGGLFAGGMPKLRPTGRQLSIQNSSANVSNSGTNNSGPRSPGTPQQQKSFSTIQSEVQSALKKQMASDSNRNRGPPPPAPIRNVSQSTENLNMAKCDITNNGMQPNVSSLHKKSNSSSTSFKTSLQAINAQMGSLEVTTGKSQPNTSALHRKASSSANLSVLDSSEPPSLSLPAKPSSRKPNVAPKPPILNGKPAAPPKRLLINGRPAGISRAQSMRSPRTPSPHSPQSPEDSPLSYQAKFGTVRNLSSVLDKSLGQSLNQRSRPALNGRPSAPPPSAPTQQVPPPPPPPSSKTVAVKPPSHAPPPPPTVIPQPPNHPPPPPPHRTPQPSRAPPAVPTVNQNLNNNTNVNNNNAPPPPPRHSSMRDSATSRRISPVDLELKYKEYFHSISEIPNPPIFRGIPKIYSSRNAAGSKQQAPPPPNHVNLTGRMWDMQTC